jgi:vacuolar protein sorting-associated protein 41
MSDPELLPPPGGDQSHDVQDSDDHSDTAAATAVTDERPPMTQGLDNDKVALEPGGDGNDGQLESEGSDEENKEEEEGEEEDDDEDEDEDEDDEEPKLKYARLTQHLAAVYRNGDATSAFLVAGDKMVSTAALSFQICLRLRKI